ncbi:DUF86 domain-containing protein [Actinomyces sp. Z5]|uniref:DUF86 domain-containing protein n=1 Tax=Actinomyces sp. Z5 TaxID=2250216 RepID=UPI0037BF84FE
MRDAVSRIHQVIGHFSTEEITADPLRTDALMWNYTVLGEAANKVSRGFREAHPEIVWHRPIGLRNRIIHGYCRSTLTCSSRPRSATCPTWPSAWTSSSAPSIVSQPVLVVRVPVT